MAMDLLINIFYTTAYNDRHYEEIAEIKITGRKTITTMSLRMPKYLKSAMKDVCKNEKISLNQFVLNALSEKLSALQTLDM